MAVHPHVCGEQDAALGLSRPAAGSSPRMWGTELAGEPFGEFGRFIPTYVGNRPFLTHC